MKILKRIDEYVVMMQREVANRLEMQSRNKDYNSLIILLNYYTNVEYLFTVPKKYLCQHLLESALVKIMTKMKKLKQINKFLNLFVLALFSVEKH